MNKGFGIVSVLIAAIMLSLIMGATMQLMQYGMLAANQNEARQGLNNLAEDLRPFTSCSNGVTGIDINTIGSAYGLKNVSIVLLNPNQIAVQGEALKPVIGPKVLKPRIIMTTTCTFPDHNHDGHRDYGQLHNP